MRALLLGVLCLMFACEPAFADSVLVNKGPSLGNVATTTTGSGNVVRGTSPTMSDIIDAGYSVSTAQLDKTSNTTLASVTGLSVTLTAGGTYVCGAHLTGTGTANGGAKVSVNAGSGALTATSSSFTAWDWNGTTLNTVVTKTDLGNVVASTTAWTDIMIRGAIVVNAGGPLVVQFAQNASHADTSSVYVNSDLWCKRVN